MGEDDESIRIGTFADAFGPLLRDNRGFCHTAEWQIAIQSRRLTVLA